MNPVRVDTIFASRIALTYRPSRYSNVLRVVASLASLACLLSISSTNINAQAVKSIVLNPKAVFGGTASVATVTLTKAAGTNGLTVKLLSDQTCASIPASVTVASGKTSVDVNISTTSVTNSTLATIIANGGGARAAGLLTVQPNQVSAFTFTPTSVLGGKRVTGNLTIAAPAPAGGITIYLVNNDPALPVPDSVQVTAGSTAASFKTTSVPVATNTNVRVDAYLNGGLQSATVKVLAPTLQLSLAPSTVVAGNSSVGTLTLSGPAPDGGLTIPLNGTGGVATIAASATIVAGAKTQTFPISTNVLLNGSELISATLNGKTVSATLTVNAASGLAASPWPKLKGNIQNTGQSNAVSATGTLKWMLKNPTSGAYFSAPVIGADGTLYLSSNDDGLFYAVNPDGTIKWSVKIGAPMGGVPAVGADGTIYFGANDNRLYAISSTGSIKWSFLTNLNILSSPTLGPDGTIYFGSADAHLYALNPNGTQKWSFKAGANIYSSPGLAPDGTLYIGSEDNYVYAINSQTGVLKWSVKTGHVVRSSPAIAPDGTIYVGCWDTKAYAINPNGTVKWTFKTGVNSIAFPSPAIGNDGTIYVGSWNANFYALNPNGTTKWTYTMATGTGNSPAIASDGTIYVPCDNGSLYALNPNGSRKWVYSNGTGASCPAIGKDGTVYVSLGGSLVAIQ